MPKKKKRTYYELWDSINAKRGHSWILNPWVYVISFEPIGREMAEGVIL
jgi:hypothetical protein